MAEAAATRATYRGPTRTDEETRFVEKDGKLVEETYKVKTPLSFIDGIPARDLTEEDWAALTPDQRKAVGASDLYEVASATATTKKEGAGDGR